MSKSDICEKIHKLVLKYAKKYEAPTAYINIELGYENSLNEETLHAAFNHVKWDTPLSSAELFIRRKPASNKKDTSLTVVSLSHFEEDGKEQITVPIDCAIIME